jgi:hypothetical protein
LPNSVHLIIVTTLNCSLVRIRELMRRSTAYYLDEEVQ